MTKTPGDYRTALTEAIEGEIAGEAYFEAMAGHHEGSSRASLRLMADMERSVALALTPLVARYGLQIADRSALCHGGHQRGLEDGRMAWPDFLKQVSPGYQVYVDEFEQVTAMAPAEERELVHLLVEHEIAFMDFARAGQAGDPDCQGFLTRFIAHAEAVGSRAKA